MKKMIIMLVLGALAFAAQANIVNGDFEGNPTTNATSASSQLSGNPISLVLNKGWYTNTVTTLATISGGVLTRGTAGSAQKSGVVQFFTDSQIGALQLQYDMLVTDANASDTIWIQLYGYKYSTTFVPGSAIMTSTDNSRLIVNSTATPAGSTNWTVTALVDYSYALLGTLDGGAWSTGRTITFLDTDVLAGEYDMYGLRVLAGGVDAADIIQIDNMSVGVVPEPATALLFGIGGFGAWMLRRNNRKAKEEQEG